MRPLLTLLLFVCSFSAAAKSRYLLLPKTLPVLAREMQPSQVLAVERGVSLIKVGIDEIEKLGELVHHELGGCGGFIDVTHEISTGMLPEHIVLAEVDHQMRKVSTHPIRVVGKPEIERLISNASDTRYWNFLTKLTQFPDRSATTSNGKKAAEYLKDQATLLAGGRMGFTAEFVSTGSDYDQPSVLAKIPGSDPSLPAVIIGAHMDTFSNGKPGADDDGTGTALLLEVLTTIVESWAMFRHNIYFAWYSAEERGLVGSGYVVRKFKNDKTPVKVAMQVDMVGLNSSSDSSDIYVLTDNTNPTFTSQLKQLATTYTTAKVGETACGYACSDHANWHRNGFPAVAPFETSFDNMNSRIHTGSDTMAALDKAHAFRFVQLALAFLAENAVLISR